MNREIKFRAWDVHKQMMIYFENDSMWDTNWMETSYCMQYTGLKDKNGKDIYEGDILSHDFDKRLFNWIIFFENGCFGIKNIGIDGFIDDFFQIDSSSFFTDREIIGNIYENPKLLK